MEALARRRLVVVAGKGGVGRTTLSLVIGRATARTGRRTLVCLTHAPSRYADLVGGITLGPELTELDENLFVVNLDPVASQEEYGRQVLPSRLLHRLVFGSRIVRAFFDAVPGLAEWALFGKATWHALGYGVPAFDQVVFDAPATGHGLDILSLPRAIVGAVPAGRIRDEAEERLRLITDPERCEVVPVTIPEELPVNETLELVHRLARLGLPVRRVVANMVADVDGASDLEALVADEPPDGRGAPWLVPVRAAIGRSAHQRAELERLERELGLPLVLLPHLGAAGLDEPALGRLVAAFARAAG